jgi:UDP-glucose 4-epimerase
MSKAILVTGGAGYIGSHVLLQLQARGERVVVIDNLYTGFRQAVRTSPLVVGDIGDRALVAQVLREHDVDTVMHFAANTIVPESVSDPLKYYGNNTAATRNLLEACMQHGVHQLVFSSTAAVYGIPAGGIAKEEMPLTPINPYGTSKLMSEWIMRDLAAVSDFRYVALRYFNVAGSDPQERIGQSTRKATLLIKVACEAIVGKRPHVSISAPTTTRQMAPAYAITSTLRIWRAPTLLRSTICEPVASPRRSTAATATVTAFAKCSTACSA